MTPYSQALSLLSNGQTATKAVAHLESEGVHADDARVAVRAAWHRLKPGTILLTPRSRTSEVDVRMLVSGFEGGLLTATTLLVAFASAMAFELLLGLSGAAEVVRAMGLPHALSLMAEYGWSAAHALVALGMLLLLKRQPLCRPALVVALALLTLQGAFEAGAFFRPSAHLLALPLLVYFTVSKQLTSLLDG